MLENAERTQESLEKKNQAHEARLESMLAAVTTSNENVARIGQTLARNESYNGEFASTAPQQLPTQSITMAPAMSTVQPRRIALSATTYQAAPPLRAIQSQITSY